MMGLPTRTSQERAFLDMLAVSEGTYGRGDDGYNVVVGNSLFSGYDDHPRIHVRLHSLGITSTAAGRYQILEGTYDSYKHRLGLLDFSPASQDAIALQLIKERRALDFIECGLLDHAIAKCANIWASLPGAGYGQHENKLVELRNAFIKHGGMLA